MSKPMVSILINNYNYARFLEKAVDSALNQDYSETEIIVVDDGSTDESRHVISSYGDRIVKIFQENKGQASAFNAGVAASRGDILCFLDADDFFYPHKVGRVVDLFREQGPDSKPIMVHHGVAFKDEDGSDIDRSLIKMHEAPLNLYAYAKRYGFLYFATGPTTGVSLNRHLALRVFPIPEEGMRTSADEFVVLAASLIGDVYASKDILAGYRIHGKNIWYFSDRKKTREFMGILQAFLNKKLVENDMLPVISFDDSMYDWWMLFDERRWTYLAWQVMKLCLKQHDRHTAEFAYGVLKGVGSVGLKALREQVRLPKWLT